MPLVNSTHRHLRSAFTLVELLTVIAIVGILAAIIIPVVGKVRDSARKTECVSNLRQIGTSMRLYANENRGNFPPMTPPLAGGGTGTWVDAIFPYLATRSSSAQGAVASGDLLSTVFICPKGTDPSPNNNTYGYNEGLPPQGAAFDTQPKTINAVVSPGQTMLAVDYNQRRFQLTNNNKISASAMRHDGTLNLVFVDGHVGNMTESAFSTVYLAGQNDTKYRSLFLGR